MSTEATKEIMFIVDEEEERKKSIEAALNRLQNQKRKREFRLLRNQLMFNTRDTNDDLEITHQRLNFWKNTNIINDLNHKIMDQRNRFVRASRAIGETLHWTSLSEHKSRRDRKKAIEMARESAR